MGIVNTIFANNSRSGKSSSFLEAEPELYIVNSFISNPDLKPDGLRLQN
jgi:hypothetical protein